MPFPLAEDKGLWAAPLRLSKGTGKPPKRP